MKDDRAERDDGDEAAEILDDDLDGDQVDEREPVFRRHHPVRRPDE